MKKNLKYFTSTLMITLIAIVITVTHLDQEAEHIYRIYQQFLNDKENYQGQIKSEHQERAFVTRIIDGDTIKLKSGKKVRYIGIDTPETKHPQKGVECYGQEASAENRKLVLNKTVTLEQDVSETDRYGRLLRYVYVGDTFVNQYLVAQGYAQAVSFPPDVKYQETFKIAEQDARENNLGLWSDQCSSE